MKFSIKNNIPNTITILNIISGVIGIIFTLRYNEPKIGIIFMLIAGVFDLSDGLAARILNARSEIGKELDSLCDVVSFGVLPGVLMYTYMDGIITNESYSYIALVSLMIPAFAAIRLAIFNTTEQSLSTFSGLSSPGAAFFIASIILNNQIGRITEALPEAASLAIMSIIVIAVSFLMVSKVKLLTLKFHSKQLKDNYITIFMIIASIVLASILGFDSLLYIFLLYIILSIIFAK